MGFTGAKLALFLGDQLLVIRRDLKPCIPFPGFWDFPGGGRERDETPEECVIRETFEEVGLTIANSDLIWSRQYNQSWFFAAILSETKVSSIRFGEEGECWALMTPQAYLDDPMAIPHFASRLQDYLADA